MSTPTALPAPTLADMIDLRDRTAIVTGGAMGIGRGIASRLHEAGANLVVADRDRASVVAIAAAFEAERLDSAIPVVADVGDPAEVDAMVAETVERFGGVDILVNNAGIYPFAGFVDEDPAMFERVLRVNLVGAFLTMQAVARQMIAQGRGGRIINVTSIDALHPSSVGLSHYDASKHGLWGLTKNVALELAEHGIWVNALAPGAVATPGTSDPDLDPSVLEQTLARIPMHRMASPDEMGRIAVFLASDLSSYMTGTQIVADGGLLLR
jgi:2-deoxy-D-gluconate 3-dehydrogenase